MANGNNILTAAHAFSLIFMTMVCSLFICIFAFPLSRWVSECMYVYVCIFVHFALWPFSLHGLFLSAGLPALHVSGSWTYALALCVLSCTPFFVPSNNLTYSSPLPISISPPSHFLLCPLTPFTYTPHRTRVPYIRSQFFSTHCGFQFLCSHPLLFLYVCMSVSGPCLCLLSLLRCIISISAWYSLWAVSILRVFSHKLSSSLSSHSHVLSFAWLSLSRHFIFLSCHCCFAFLSLLCSHVSSLVSKQAQARALYFCIFA